MSLFWRNDACDASSLRASRETGTKVGWTLWLCRCHLRNRFHRQVRHSPRYHPAPALPDFNKQLCSSLMIAFPHVRCSSSKRQLLGRLWNLDTSAEDTIARFAKTDFRKVNIFYCDNDFAYRLNHQSAMATMQRVSEKMTSQNVSKCSHLFIYSYTHARWIQREDYGKGIAPPLQLMSP